MATARKAPARKTAAKKTKKKEPATKQAELREARAYVLQYNFGLSSRVREMLDEKRAVLQILVDEKLPLSKIQEYIQQHFGPKIGVKALDAYLQETFYRPKAAPTAARRAPAKTGSKRRR